MNNYNLNVDVLQYFLPLMMALFLFEPLFYVTQNISSVFFSSVLFGTFFTPLISQIAGELIDLTSKEFNKVDNEAKKNNKKWNYDKLSIQYLTKEDKDFIYLTNAYCQFYLVNSFIFMIYGIANIELLIISLLQVNWQLGCYIIIDQLLTILTTTKTPVFDSGNVNTAFIIIITILFFHGARDSCYRNYKLLYIDLYPMLAEKYNNKDNQLIRLFIKGRAKK